MAQAQLAEVKKAIQEVNWSRKNQQTQVLFFRPFPLELLFNLSFLSYQVGDKLRQLETSWVGLVSKNYEIEQVRYETSEFLWTQI